MTDITGKVVWEQDYLPFGEDLHKPGTSVVDFEVETRYKFTGQRQVIGIGLYYYGARYYDSETGRFITEDVYRGNLINPLSQNLYIYVLQNPLKYVDLTGHMANFIIGPGGGSPEPLFTEEDKKLLDLINNYEISEDIFGHPFHTPVPFEILTNLDIEFVYKLNQYNIYKLIDDDMFFKVAFIYDLKKNKYESEWWKQDFSWLGIEIAEKVGENHYRFISPVVRYPLCSLGLDGEITEIKSDKIVLGRSFIPTLNFSGGVYESRLIVDVEITPTDYVLKIRDYAYLNVSGDFVGGTVIYVDIVNDFEGFKVRNSLKVTNDLRIILPGYSNALDTEKPLSIYIPRNTSIESIVIKTYFHGDGDILGGYRSFSYRMYLPSYLSKPALFYPVNKY
ncbi:hypothetical protein BBF96_08900 [Anoxybacter fermentans]|uniref:RHS repeat-associated core domain-containing protein n=1 Tax=Anoxybacter fermentans TaxID=1323375 RepID=A0A3S9SYW7_9FIRM|nr:RHS repeat-associated core domain-containing protein [Anoxybacter fermentans]AZR73491.1 hypothetical protein BBF96_08900 [Anoxybacter fermentans]